MCDEETRIHKAAYKKHETDSDVQYDRLITQYSRGEVSYDDAASTIMKLFSDVGDREMALCGLNNTLSPDDEYMEFD